MAPKHRVENYAADCITFDVPRQLESDFCLDQGGRFDYGKAQCDSPRNGE